MIVDQSQRADLGPLLGEHVGIRPSADFKAIAQLDAAGELVAVVGYNGFFCDLCFIHTWIPQPKKMNRAFTRALFEYPFVMLQRVALLSVIEPNNHKALGLNLHAGFRVIDTFQNGATILRMNRDECRWIKGDRHAK